MKLRLILTEKCNWTCPYCDCRAFNTFTPLGKNKDFNMATFKLDMNIINSQFDYDTVTFSGGEPGLLTTDDMSELFYMFRDKRIQIFTNGQMFNHNIPANVENIFVHTAVYGQIGIPESLRDITHHRCVVNSEIIQIPDVPRLLLVPAIGRYSPPGPCIFTAIRYVLIQNNNKRWITVPLISKTRQRQCVLQNEMIFNVPRRLMKECHGKAGKRPGFPLSEISLKDLDADMYGEDFCKTCWYPFELSKDEFEKKTGKNANEYLVSLMKNMSYTDAVTELEKLL